LGILHEQAGQGRIITYRISKRRLLELLQQQAMPLASAMRSAATTSVAAAALMELVSARLSFTRSNSNSSL
jgi:hypothetical protein